MKTEKFRYTFRVPRPISPPTPSDLLTRLRFHWRKGEKGQRDHTGRSGRRQASVFSLNKEAQRPWQVSSQRPSSLQARKDGSLLCCAAVLIILVWSLSLPLQHPEQSAYHTLLRNDKPLSQQRLHVLSWPFCGLIVIIWARLDLIKARSCLLLSGVVWKHTFHCIHDWVRPLGGGRT